MKICWDCKQELTGEYVKYRTHPVLYFCDECWCHRADAAKRQVESFSGDTKWLKRELKRK